MAKAKDIVTNSDNKTLMHITVIRVIMWSNKQHCYLWVTLSNHKDRVKKPVYIHYLLYPIPWKI